MKINANDETYWAGIRRQFAVTDDFINLENGYFGIQAKPVFDAFQRYNVMVNQQASYFLRTKFAEHVEATLTALADFTGAAAEELVLTRNATEAMNILIQGYPFKAGDEVVLCNQDYNSVIETFEMMQQRRGIKLVSIRLPLHPQNDDEIVAQYERAITPRTRVLLLTHMLHMSGQILPVAKIAHMARARGVDVMVDAAHSFAQIEYRLPDLDSDFAAVNLHKWLGAPLGVGLLYIRKERIAEIAPLFGDTTFPATDIRKLAHFGTMPPAPILAIRDALAFHHSIGSANKEARLRYLKDYWVNRVAGFRGLEMLTPAAPERACAIAAFRVKDMAAQEVVDYLFAEHRIFTVERDIDGTAGVRVTPHLYNTVEQLECLVKSLERFA